jgi:hypothetical protein
MANPSKAYSGFVHILLAGAIIAIGILAMENSRLRSLIPTSRPASAIAAGDSLLHVEAVDSSGSVLTLPAGVHLFFFFKSSCQMCKETLPVWNALADSLRNARISVTGLSFDEKQESSPEHSSFTVGRLKKARDFALENRIFAVPLTVLADQKMKVLALWHGPIDYNSMSSIIHSAKSAVAVHSAISQQ